MNKIIRKIQKIILLSRYKEPKNSPPIPEIIATIDKSNLFDTAFYISNYLKKNVSKEEAIWHYIVSGVKLKYNPSEYFDTAYYLKRNPAVEKERINPLLHYILFGWKEGRMPNPNFDSRYYVESNQDVKSAGFNPLYHYMFFGKYEDRATNSTTSRYAEWVENYDTISRTDVALMRKMADTFSRKPLISMIMPVYNPDIKYIKKAIESVINQVYDNWELCMADDASTDPMVKITLDEYVRKDKRIKVNYRKVNGHISEASNSAIEIATGEFIALMDQDDELAEHALFMVAYTIANNPDACLIYSDEDKMDMTDTRNTPYFKSNWNKDLFYGHNMLCHLDVYKLSIFRKIGCYRKGYEGSQDYDVILRFTEQIKPEQIKHIPHILYHWRTFPGSVAQSGGSKGYAWLNAKRALEDHLTRTGQKGEVVDAPNSGHRILRALPEKLPLVSIIIPVKKDIELLEKCINSIVNKTRYNNYEIIIVDNGGTENTKKQLNEIKAKHKNLSVIENNRSVNYSAVNNMGVKAAKGDIVGLLHCDTEVINEEWLSEIVSHVMRKEVGAVGAKLYFEDGRIQHAGIVLGINTVGAHIYKNSKKNYAGNFNRLLLTQNFSAVSSACLFVQKSLYNEIGGFDETNLSNKYNDIDFCLRLQEKGYINVWTPFAELYHYESAEIGDNITEMKKNDTEVDYMYTKWGKTILNDPYYNPNLSLSNVEYKFEFPPRAKYPWKNQ
ncbi:MAG TPA: glycosyltransferase family 2 protein [Bacteroidia bacterium]|nr:glycosyltransferase family 2 protein [Bacteroidia bacterium]